MKGRVVVFQHSEGTADGDPEVQLFPDLADQRLLRALARFDLPARELPAAPGTLRGKHPVAVTDHRGRHADGLHPSFTGSG